MGVQEKTNYGADGDCSEGQGLHSLPLVDLRTDRRGLQEYFKNTWALTEMLFSGLASDEAYYLRPYHKTRHPLIFYYAHPVCFYVNKLLVSGLIDEPVNPELELLFEAGVDEMNWDDLHEGEADVWPTLEEVRAYRDRVYQLVSSVIAEHPVFEGPITSDSPGWSVVMAFEHERIHLETSSVLMRELPVEMLRKPQQWPASKEQSTAQCYAPEASVDYPDNSELIPVESTVVQLGKPREWPSFGWDNEYGSEERRVDAFSASRYLISNGEFFEFVSSGGYENASYWTEAAWAWRRFRNVKWPTFWVQDGPAGSHRYKLRTIFEEIPMQWSWPAIVNYFEAEAYCAWRTQYSEDGSERFRLLRESEHNAIRGKAAAVSIPNMESPGSFDTVMSHSQHQSINNNLNYGTESPVAAFEANELGFHDVFGNLWQWCEDAFHPLTDFSIHPYYTDFSTPCFDGEHQMILGGSFISTGDEASVWSRFHFRPHFFQHAGFRIVRSTDADFVDKYEKSEVVDQYLLFHFGSEKEQYDAEISSAVGHPAVKNLLTRTVELMEAHATEKTRALDLGCAVGRQSFDLSTSFEEVVGIDYSDAFVRVAEAMRTQQKLSFQRWETGRHKSSLVARMPTNARPERISFRRGDASHLDKQALRGESEQSNYDAILLSNLMCRLSDPAACLRQFTGDDEILKRGGVLVIASPNSWMEEYTQPEDFLDGEDSASTLAAIGSVLEGFELLHCEDLPFMIREHRRKYEYIVSQISVWRKPL